MRSRDHVGELRPPAPHTYGVGATVELPEMTRSCSAWTTGRSVLGEVTEPRLLPPCAPHARAQVERLAARRRSCPRARALGVPVAPFPRWLRCPLCSLLAPIDHGVFQLHVDA